MEGAYSKNLDTPDETFRFPGGIEDIVDLGDITVGRVVTQPGWRWSKDVRPLVGGEWCQARHVGVVISGRLGITLQDGTRLEFGRNDVYQIPPGHDGYTVGDEPAVVVEWTGLRAFAGFRAGAKARVLATLVFTDIVDSTAFAAQLGDVAWRELLSQHLEAVRREIDNFNGREVKTTGDGMLVTFDGPARALQFAHAVCREASKEDLEVRIGVHVGEVEMVGADVRGVAVHAAARIMSEAAGNEILVSATTRTLAEASGFSFEELGSRTLRGLPGEWSLYAYRPDGG